MNFTYRQRKRVAIRLAVLGAMIALGLAVWPLAAVADAYEVPIQPVANTMAQAQEGGGPEANLPYLFAVYIVTWAAFFGYVFYVSHRQRDMQGEIEALRRALNDRDRSVTEQSEEVDSEN